MEGKRVVGKRGYTHQYHRHHRYHDHDLDHHYILPTLLASVASVSSAALAFPVETVPVVVAVGHLQSDLVLHDFNVLI